MRRISMTTYKWLRANHLLLGASLGVLTVAAPAAAQDQNDGETAAATSEADGEIVVTGSRLRGVAPVGSTVISLGREEIDSSSAVTVDRMIKEIPQNFDLGVSE